MNGFEIWRKLYERYSAPTRQRAVGSLTRILATKFDTYRFEDSLVSMGRVNT